jgi:hypothetical protein
MEDALEVEGTKAIEHGSQEHGLVALVEFEPCSQLLLHLVIFFLALFSWFFAGICKL